ncbi:radical SAM protein [uncultured Ruegeria sp.]|uniref:B12-binding domain-containing radical SAM protein n=1 Tax=uncultured Ruegeria sp. TaxID=259304 RepID=UPI00260FCB82|nr:radical SAM protein [uncultured Ruegeria sp.]
MTKTIYLVNAANDESIASIANDYSFPALNILALGTWLKAAFPDIEIICRDGGICGTELIQREINTFKPWLVGIGALCTSYHTALELARIAKSVGAYTVFGNDHAAHLSRQIVRNRPDVDFVIAAEYGEYALELLVRELLDGVGDFAGIASLTYRTPRGQAAGFDYTTQKDTLAIANLPFQAAKQRKGALDIFPTVDRSLYPQYMWDSYLENYKSAFGHLHGDHVPTGITTMNRARGCSRANENIKCKHCDMLLDVSFSSGNRFWDEVRTANAQVKSEVFYEVCDSLTSFPRFIRDVVKSKPDDLDFDPMFFIYGQALDIIRNDDLGDLLAELNVFKLNIGLESGCDRTLKHMKGPKDSVEINETALRILKSRGINVYGSFVLGTEPETSETLRTTVDWIKRIIDEGLISDVEAQPILPLHNNHYGKQLFSSYNPKTEDDWPIDIDEVSREYISRHSGVSYDDCISAANEIRQHARQGQINFGSGLSKKENYSVEVVA